MSETRTRILNAAKNARLRAQAQNKEVPALELPALKKLDGEFSVQLREKLRRSGAITEAPYVYVLEDNEKPYFGGGAKPKHVAMRS